MSLNLSINSCEKICLTLSSATCAPIPPNEFFTWTSTDTTIATVNSNNINAIVEGVYGPGGSCQIQVKDLSLTIVFVINLTVTDYLNTTVLNPNTKMLFSSALTPSFFSTQTQATISGPFNSLVGITNPNLCYITFFSQDTGSFINSNLFNLGSASSTLQSFGSFIGGFAVRFYFSLFIPTGGSDINPLIPFASSITMSPTSSGLPQTFNLGFRTPCFESNYLSFVQLDFGPGNTRFVNSSQLTSGSILNMNFWPTAPTSTFKVSAVVVPNNYFNLLSTTLIYSNLRTILITSAAFTFALIVPFSGMSVNWYVQQYDTTPGNEIRIRSAILVGATLMVVGERLTSTVKFNTTISIIAFAIQSSIGYSITFP